MTPSWYEHVDLLNVLLVVAIGYMVWSFKAGLNDFKVTIKDLYAKYDGLSRELNILQGEHNAMTCQSRKAAVKIEETT